MSNALRNFTLSCIKQVTSRKLLCNTGTPAWYSAMTWTWDGGGQGGSEKKGGASTHTHLYV